MNKDVIYIEPDDDITDIITKVEKSKERIIALVPPRKAGVFRSAVNIKLIAKSGLAQEKTVVLVTVDPSIIKLAAAARIPVTKNLQSAPSIPTDENVMEAAAQSEVVEVTEESESEKGAAETRKKASSDEKKPDDDTDEDDAEVEQLNANTNPDDFLDNTKAEKQKEKAKKKSEKGAGNWFSRHKKLVIISSIAAVVLAGVLVWALAFAPAVTVDIAVQTESKNFSENVSFTTNLSDENAEEGKFYIEQKKSESVNEVTFVPTGQKNNGNKASGTVVISAYFRDSGAVAINSGSSFSVSGLTFFSTEDATLTWGGDDSECDNSGSLARSGCQISARVSVIAGEAGAKYNIAATASGWSTTAAVGVYSDSAMSGGTDDIVTVVQQSDIETAKRKLTSEDEDAIKEKLFASIDDDYITIDSSFKMTESAVVATPAAGEVVGEGVTPSLKLTTTSTVYVIDKTKLIQFITEKVDLADDQKIYEVNDPRVESFAESNSGYVGKIKTTYLKGPSLVDSEIMEKIRGKGLGDAQYELRKIEGVSEVVVTPSYPWVVSVPNDSSKIEIHTDIKDNSDTQNTDDTNTSTNEEEAQE